MANRAKEDEKNERIIRGLLKLSENRRCINCNSLGPQYVCLNFWTFVCTTCSGIHREFTHRVKSISMAKFTSQEVAALQGGGNQRAREFYFKEWESQHQTSPDSSNVDRLRDFIKHVYVDKKYSGERSLSKPPRAKEGDKEEMYENKITDGSRSPYDRSYSGRNSPGGRSDNRNFRDGYDGKNPGYEQGNQQYDNHRSPTRPQVVNDWRREDRFGSGDFKLEGRSPDRQKDVSSPPIIRPVRDILKENVSLRVIEPPKSNPSKITDGFSQQRTASSSSFGSDDKNFVEPKKNLIDFDAEPDIPAAQQAQQTTGILPISQSVASSTSENWASFDFAAEPKAPQAPAPVNTLESVLSQLSVSSPVPVQVSDNSSGGDTMTRGLVGGTSSALPLGYTSITTFSGGFPAAAPGNNFSAFPPVSTSVGSPTSAPILPVNDVGQWPSVQNQQHTLFSSTGNQLAAHQFTPVGGAFSNQQWNSSLPSSAQVLTTVSPASQAILKQGQETNSVVTSQSPLLQVNSGGRKELPEDLFAAYYSSAPVPRPGWQMGPPVGTMQYHNIVAIPTNPQSSNPFDLNVRTLQTSASVPSMASLHGAFSNLPHPTSSSLLRTSSLGSSSPYTAVLPPHTPSYVSAVPPRAYIGQQAQSNMFAVRHQGLADYGNMGPAFSPLDPNPQLAGQYSAPAGGNPFA